jgi:hypothetical protein
VVVLRPVRGPSAPPIGSHYVRVSAPLLLALSQLSDIREVERPVPVDGSVNGAQADGLTALIRLLPLPIVQTAGTHRRVTSLGGELEMGGEWEWE